MERSMGRGASKTALAQWRFGCGCFEQIDVGEISTASSQRILAGEDFDRVLYEELGFSPQQEGTHPRRFLGASPREVLKHGGPCWLEVDGEAHIFADSEILVVGVDDEPVPPRAAGRWSPRCCRVSDLGRIVEDDRLRNQLEDSLNGDASVVAQRRGLPSSLESLVWAHRTCWTGSNAQVELTAPADSDVLLVFGYVRSIIAPIDPYDRSPEAGAARSLSWSGVYLAALSIGSHVLDWFEPEEDYDRRTRRFLFGEGPRSTLRVMFAA
jgi:hypothetical protein